MSTVQEVTLTKHKKPMLSTKCVKCKAKKTVKLLKATKQTLTSPTSVFKPSWYSQAWRESKALGLFKRFSRDLRACAERSTKGYCYEDLWNIDAWFLTMMPRALEEFKRNKHGYPAVFTDDGSDEGEKKWDAIIDEMIFHFKEASEDTCTRKNPLEKQYNKASDEFIEKYGFMGEGLQTAEEKAEIRKGGYHRVHTMSELPEYKDIVDNYLAEEHKLDQYRDEHKTEGMKLFNKWLRDLWD